MDKLKDYIMNKTEEVNINLLDSVNEGSGNSQFSIAQIILNEDDHESVTASALIYNLISYSEDLRRIEVFSQSTQFLRSGMSDILLYNGESIIRDPDEVITSYEGAIEKTIIDGEVGYIVSGGCAITYKSYGV